MLATAPSFGPVHLSVPGPDGRPRPCYPRRSGPACWVRHGPDDPALGQPVDPAGYDYPGQVLWNAYAGQLWRRFVTYLPRHLAKAAGLTVGELTEQVRVSFAKVAEYQRRGVVHFHAVIRLDHRHGDHGPPPAWATLELLEDAIRAAAAAAHLEVNAPSLGRDVRLGWGDQVDVRPIAAFGDGEPVTEETVAGYIAKYATKATEATEATGALDRRVTGYNVATLHRRGIPAHTAQLIGTCWQLGDPTRHPELADLKLRRWCHMLGFRGHFTTKSRAYSTTLGQLRQARTDHAGRDDEPDPDPETTLVLAHWRYARQGYTPGESLLPAALASPAAPDPPFDPRGDHMSDDLLLTVPEAMARLKVSRWSWTCSPGMSYSAVVVTRHTW